MRPPVFIFTPLEIFKKFHPLFPRSAKIKKTSILFLKYVFLTGLIFSWLFSGWPQIWTNPKIPPKIPQAMAAITFERMPSEASTTPSVSISVAVNYPDDLIYNGSIGSVGLTLEPLLKMKWWGIAVYTETDNFISECVSTASPLLTAIFTLGPGDYKTEIALSETKEGCEAYSSEDFSGNVYPLFAVLESANFAITQ